MCHGVCLSIKADADLLWYEHANLENYDAILLPGGFSYGDYLRTGAIAATSNVMQQVKQHAAQGAAGRLSK